MSDPQPEGDKHEEGEPQHDGPADSSTLDDQVQNASDAGEISATPVHDIHDGSVQPAGGDIPGSTDGPAADAAEPSIEGEILQLQPVDSSPETPERTTDGPSHDAAIGEPSDALAHDDDAEGTHPEPRDVTPATPLPSTILAPLVAPAAQTDLNAEPSADSPDLALFNALKAQLRAVEEQRDQLNTKLVRSLERCADLEDEVFHAQDADKQKAAKIVTLEEERKEHLHALDTGLLIEEANVKNEMQRLASSLAEAQGKRELAEEGKRTVENEVDDLAASLFQQANSMVATERLSRARAEARLKEAEDNLSVAESVVREMQQAMQDLHHASKTRGMTTSASMNSLMAHASAPRPLRTAHLPYSEFLLFVNHVRALRPLTTTPAQIPPPLLTSLLSQPLLARLLAEDHDPALRLDFAPGVGWISKKGITNAIVEGMLMVEPVSSTTVFSQKPDTDIVCALSGKLIAPAPVVTSYSYGGEGMLALAGAGLPLSSAPPPAHPSRSTASRFFSRSHPSRPASPTSSTAAGQPVSPPSGRQPSTIFVFRIAPPSNVPLSEQKSSTLYPVEAGWSLDRLRATCELWRFVKTGILQPIWAYEDGTERPPPPPPPPAAPVGERASSAVSGLTADAGKKPELPPRKKSWGLSGWGLGRSADKTLPPPLAAPSPQLPPRKLPPPVVEVDKEAEPVTAPAVTEPVVVEEAAATDPEPAKVDAVVLGPKDEIVEPAADDAPTPPVVEISSTEPDRAASPTPVVLDDDSSPAEQAADCPPQNDGDNKTVPDADTPSPSAADESTVDGASGSLAVEQTSPTPDSGAESDAFQTPTEEEATHPIEKELADKESAAAEEGVAIEAEAEQEPAEGSADDADDKTTKPVSVPDDAVPAAEAAVEEASTPASPVTPATPNLAPPADETSRTSVDSQRSAGAPPPLPRRAAARRPVPPPPGASAAAMAPASEDAAVKSEAAPAMSDVAKPDLPPRTSLEAQTTPAGPPPPPPRRAPGATAAAAAVEPVAPAADQEAALAQQMAEADELAQKKEAQAAQAREWEEAAWRELAAVRERLFWTRIGEEQSF